MAEVVILNAAETDVFGAYLYYDSLDDGLGETFAQQVDHAFAQISRFPEAGFLVGPGFRRMLVRRFPFGVFYSVEGHRVMIQAVLDLRQSPEQILRRLNLP